MASASILGIVIGKINYRQQFNLIALYKIDKYFKICFYYIILPFNLTVYFKVESNKKPLFNFKKVIKQ